MISSIIAQSADPAASSPHACELIQVRWHDWALEIHIGILAIIIGLATVLVVPKLWRWLSSRSSGMEMAEITVKYGLFEQKIKPNHDTVRIAYQAWVEITTRKVGLKFEEDHDTIVEVYNSWYAIFGILRELTKSVPAQKLQADGPERRLVEVLLRAMNDGLRPHLTQWQAGFRRWYDEELKNPENTGKSPQEIQRGFPKYTDLVSDLKQANDKFVAFASTLDSLAKQKS